MIPERFPNDSRTVPDLAYARGAGSREQGTGKDGLLPSSTLRVRARDDVIAAELARLILTGRGPARPELRMDSVGYLARAGIACRLLSDDLGRALLPTARRLAAAMQQVARSLP